MPGRSRDDLLLQWADQLAHDSCRWEAMRQELQDPAWRARLRHSPSYARLRADLEAGQLLAAPPLGLALATLIHEIADPPTFALALAVLEHPPGTPVHCPLLCHVGAAWVQRIPPTVSVTERILFLLNLGVALAQTPWGSRYDQLEQAIDYCEEALQWCQQLPRSRERTILEEKLHNTAGSVYQERIGPHAKRRHQEAIRHYERALRVIEEGRAHRWLEEDEAEEATGRITHNLGNAHRDRPTERGETDAQRLETAVAWFRRSLAVRWRASAKRAMTLRNLGTTLLSFASSDRSAHIEEALSCFQQALEWHEHEAQAAAATGRPNPAAVWEGLTHKLLGVAFSYRLEGPRADNVRQALTHFQAAERRYQALGLQRELISVYHDWGLLCQEEGDGTAAHEHLTAAARLAEQEIAGSDADLARTATLHFYGGVYENLLACCAGLAEQTGDAGYAAAAADWAERSRARNLGRWLQLRDAASAPSPGTPDTAATYRTLLLELQHLEHALETAERTRQDRDAAAVPSVDPHPPPFVPSAHVRQLRGRREQLLRQLQASSLGAAGDAPLSPEQARALAAQTGAALLTLRNTPAGVCAVLVPPEGAIRARLFPRLPSAELERLLRLWHRQYAEYRDIVTLDPVREGAAYGRRIDAWMGILREVTRRLGERFGRDLAAWLTAAMPPRSPSAEPPWVIVMPGPGWNILPLHALCWEEDGRRRYLADDFVFSYVPSCRVLQRCLERQRGCPALPRDALIVADPTEAAGDGLPLFQVLAADLAPLFERSVTLGPAVPAAAADTWATKERLTGMPPAVAAAVNDGKPAGAHRMRGALEQWPIAVLATHGTYAADDCWQGSHIAVASGGPGGREDAITLADFFELDLTRLWLVVLCACETAIVDDQDLTNEQLGLPAALLAAGAVTAVGSLWLVEHGSAAWLVHCFLEELLAAPQAVPGIKARALWKAGQRLRSLGRDACAAWFRRALGEQASFPAELGDYPFAEPYFWAPFVCCGAG